MPRWKMGSLGGVRWHRPAETEGDRWRVLAPRRVLRYSLTMDDMHHRNDIQMLLDQVTGQFAQRVVNILASAPVLALTQLAASTPRDPQVASQQTTGSRRTPAERAATSAPKRTPAKPASRPRSAPPALSERRRAAANAPVFCPVPGCSTPGIRRKQNFCAAHHTELPDAERNRLRTLQKNNARHPQVAPQAAT